MDRDYGLENRKYVIGGVAVFIVVVYIIRLFTLQIMSDDYKKNADSNAFLKKWSIRRAALSPTVTAGCSYITRMHTT